MSYFNTALPFIEHSCRNRMPQHLVDLYKSIKVDLSDEAGSGLKIRSTALDDWWCSWVEGKGDLTLVADNLDLFANHALLLLTQRGQHRRLNHKPLFPPPGQISFGLSASRDASVSSGDFGYLCIYIPLDQLNSSGVEAIPYGYSIGVDRGAGRVLSQAMCSLVNEVINGGDQRSLAAMLPAFSNLAIATLNHSDSVAVPRILSSRRMSRITEWLKSNFRDPDLTPDQVAAMVGISRRQLDREFARTGDSFSTRLRELRLNKARDLLRADPQTSVTQVAYEVGFSCPSVFGRLFKSSFGVTPRQFCLGLIQ